MRIVFHKNFKKSISKQSRKTQIQFKEKFKIFQHDRFHYSLNNHALSGKLKGVRSINISSDVRVHYLETSNEIILINIGTHSQLY